MKLAIAATALLACVVSASVFPRDPSGVEVIDRAFLRAYQDGNEYDLYVTLFNSEGRATVKIYEFKNGEWETVCTWNPMNLGDEYMVFNSITVLSTYDLGGKLQVSWIDRAEYHEGMVSFYVMYDYVTGDWEDGWVD